MTLKMPVSHTWFNPNIRIIISTIYLKSHFNSGYKFLKKLMADEEDNFVSLETLKTQMLRPMF